MNRTLRLGLLPIALALAGSLRADDKAAAAPPADSQASLRADNKQLTDELAAAWKESERLKTELGAAQAAAAKSAAESADLQKQLVAAQEASAKGSAESADLQKQLAAAQEASAKSAAETADLQKQLDAAKAQPPAPADSGSPGSVADLQDKLATSLRSFSVVQDENAQLKSTVDKLTSDNASLSQQLDAARASIASLQVQAAATSQIEPLRTELRQAQDETSRLASENSELKTRLAIQSPGPGATKPAPTRPAQAAAASAAAAQAAPPPPPAPRTYVVVEGDTLTKIARKFYGSSSRWEDILNANRDVMKDEKSLVVGSTLKIP
jgi:LysM repeat protein